MSRGYQLGISALLVVSTCFLLTGCGDQFDTYSRSEMRNALFKFVYPGSKVIEEKYIPASVFESLEIEDIRYILPNGVTGDEVFQYAKKYLMSTHQWGKPQNGKKIGYNTGNSWTLFIFNHKDPKGVYLDELDVGWYEMKSPHSKVHKTEIILTLSMNSAIVVKKLEHENSPSIKTLFP